MLRALFASLFCIPGLLANAQTTAEQPDPYQWLEQVSSPRALAWVKQEDERTAKVLEVDPRFAAMQASALTVLESPDRIPAPQLRDGTVYNLWRDAAHT